MMDAPFRRTAVVGAGAVGSFFGAMLARAGHAVTLIGRAAHVQAIERDGLRLEMGGKVEHVRLDAGTSLSAAEGADLVLFCVKSTDTEAAARELAPHLASDALVMSLQNGVENAATIAMQVRNPVLPTVVYVATAMPEPGCVRHFGRGDLVIGPLDATAAGDLGLARRMHDVVALFGSAGVPVKVSPDVRPELWAKLLVNCAYNAISALAQAPYGLMAQQAGIRELQHAIVREFVAVAEADGVPLTLDGAMQAVDRIAATMPGQLSSTAQDVARGKPSEIDHLNGFIARRGQALGVPTPVNQALHALVKLVEARPAS
jgi:2-dehydropantoate 2-reductase